MVIADRAKQPARGYDRGYETPNESPYDIP
jgi:hypothetical protein